MFAAASAGLATTFFSCENEAVILLFDVKSILWLIFERVNTLANLTPWPA